MIKEIQYKNFKALRDAKLPLERFTLIIGANGTGKTTAMKALEIANRPDRYKWSDLVSAESAKDGEDVIIRIATSHMVSPFQWSDDSNIENIDQIVLDNDSLVSKKRREMHKREIEGFKMFSFDPGKISWNVNISKNVELDSDGSNLAGILDFLKDTEPERWKSLNDELGRWFPEFDQILFNRHDNGKSIVLRTKIGKHKIRAIDLSDGTRLALAFLTIAYLPNTLKTVCFEEPERGIHPRLLKNIQDAMYRLAYPENYNDDREPIQVIAITHSPYLLDLYKEHPEEIVLASKDSKGVHFERLLDRPNIEEFLEDAPLGEIWYTGILGGVPANL